MAWKNVGLCRSTALIGLVLACALLPWASEALAGVTRIEITRVEPVFEGASFGAAGPYEKVVGRAFGEVDPDDPLNAGIVNLDRAPRNGEGRVEYVVDIYLLKPVDISRGNRRVYFNVLNRGNKQIIANWHDPAPGANANEPSALVDAGNGFLMRHGYTILWSAWQGDVPAGGNRMLAHFPIATNPDGSPIVATNREEFIFDNTTNPATGNLSYPAATLDPSQATLTVRQVALDPRQTPADLSWVYLSDRQIQITRPAGFDAGAIYEFIYPATDPIVMGLGFAAMRDVVSFLRHQTGDGTTANPLNDASGNPAVDYVLAFGSSQAGRYLRDFLWQGFNEDEDGRTVFDGIIPHKPGSRKTFTNFLFGQPGRFSRQHEEHDFMQTGDQFPFTYETRTDPVSGKTDGLLVRCRASETCPKVIQTESATEYWGARASLVTTDELGQHDIALPDNVRAYLFSSTQHGPAATPSLGICQQLSNPLPFSQAQRALALALDAWVRQGIEPPPSRVPRIADGTLVPPLPQAAQGFPEIPGVRYTGTVNELSILDLTVVPPVPIPGQDYTVLVPKTDANGNDLAGIRHAALEAPLATHTGWNLRREGFAEDQGCGLTGSYIPFAQTRAERLASGDPRLSIEERYRNHGAYVNAIARAAARLVQEGLWLEEDRELVVDAAAASAIGQPLP